MKSIKITKTSNLIILLTGVIFILIGLNDYLSTFSRINNSSLEIGRVIDIKKTINKRASSKKTSVYLSSDKVNDLSFIFFPVVEFKHKEGTHAFSSNIGQSPPAYKINDKVVVIYNNRTGYQIIDRGYMNYINSICLTFLGFLILSVCALNDEIPIKKRHHQNLLKI